MKKNQRAVSLNVVMWVLTVTTVVGLVAFFLGAFKPWASCPEEDTAMACPATTTETMLMMFGFGIAVISGFAVVQIRRLKN